MTGTGFHERKTASPTGLAIVVAMHVAALGALALMPGTIFVRTPTPRTTLIDIAAPKDPPEVPPPPDIERALPRPSAIEQPQTIIQTPLRSPVVDQQPYVPPEPIRFAEAGTGTAVEARPELPPLRIAAEFDPRHAGSLQPPYPTSEERAQRDGSVRVRVTIGADGRVKAVERLGATSDAFWRSTERHALARWRFRPATVDGTPIESQKTLTVTFRIEG